MQETRVQSLDWEDPLEDTAAHSIILARKIPRTQEPGGLYSPWGCRVGHNWAHIHTPPPHLSRGLQSHTTEAMKRVPMHRLGYSRSKLEPENLHLWWGPRWHWNGERRVTFLSSELPIYSQDKVHQTKGQSCHTQDTAPVLHQIFLTSPCQEHTQPSVLLSLVCDKPVGSEQLSALQDSDTQAGTPPWGNVVRLIWIWLGEKNPVRKLKSCKTQETLIFEQSSWCSWPSLSFGGAGGKEATFLKGKMTAGV